MRRYSIQITEPDGTVQTVLVEGSSLEAARNQAQNLYPAGRVGRVTDLGAFDPNAQAPEAPTTPTTPTAPTVTTDVYDPNTVFTGPMVRFIQDTLTKGQNYNPGLLDLRNTNWSVNEIVDKINQTNLPGANSPLFDNDRINTLIEVFGDNQKELGVDDASVNNQKAVLQDYFSKVSLGKNNESTINRLVGNMTADNVALNIAAGFTTNPVAFQTEGVSYLADQNLTNFGGSGDANQEFGAFSGATDAMSGMAPPRGPGTGPNNGNNANPTMTSSNVDPLGNLGLNFDDQPFTQFVQGISNLYGDQFRRGPFRRQIENLFTPLQQTYQTLADLSTLGLPGLAPSAQQGGGFESFGEFLGRLGGMAGGARTGIGNIARQQFGDAFSALRGYRPSGDVFGADLTFLNPLDREEAAAATPYLQQALANQFRSPVYRSLRTPSIDRIFADYQLGQAGQGAFAPTFSGTDTPNFLEFAAQMAGL